jgi:PTH1 family peptidyl-tRNA hydrolase
MVSVYLIVGLGNPGKRYRETRHNLGFIVLENLADELGLRFRRGKGPFRKAEGRIGTGQVMLIKPQTYMNQSGIAVGSLMAKRSVALSDLLVVCDDLNLPLGRIRIRARGSDGGHKGLASIIQTLHSDDFPRLRLGIGNDPLAETTDFVLSRFRKTERTAVESMVEMGCRAVVDIITRGIDTAMNAYNS